MRQLDTHHRAKVPASEGHFVVAPLQTDAIFAKPFINVQC
ncbi:hypothetical protein PA08_0733 [Cutibacterium modestum P08]|nr:hypothetical protein PA08_0733 [Cutibacterium modestum P08]